MNYPFVCPKCGHNEIISMPMTEYTDKNHLCPKCNTEMKRDIASYGCMSIDKTNSFFRRTSI